MTFLGPKTFYACIIGPVMADFRRWFMKKDPTMNRLSASRFCVVSGKYLTVAGLVLLAIRSFAIEIFSFPPENNYIAPAGRVMEPEEETFSFAAASDTGAKNAPIERIVKQGRKAATVFCFISAIWCVTAISVIFAGLFPSWTKNLICLFT